MRVEGTCGGANICSEKKKRVCMFVGFILFSVYFTEYIFLKDVRMLHGHVQRKLFMLTVKGFFE